VKNFDVIVIGGGHSGIEAALASARMGLQTLMVTTEIKTIGKMPCNPSIGGPGKSQLVFEINALGGEMPKAADATFLQMKMLNLSKGPAVQSLRAQSDKDEYAGYMQKTILNQPNLTVNEAMVDGVLVENDCIAGINTKFGPLTAKAVVITAGTFLKGITHCGFETVEEGRRGEKPSVGLSDSLNKIGIRLGRLKTGTPPRLLKESIDFSVLEVHGGTEEVYRFSDVSSEEIVRKNLSDQLPCYLTYTTEETHEIIRKNINASPLYNGNIKGIGPRYCPSIEDKVMRFPDKLQHHLFIEPQTRNGSEMYLQGFSTSYPAELQELMVKSLPGMKNVKILQYGYAVEYDFVYPDQLYKTFESKKISGLYFAGQICGTSGYEEAAAQGLMAGINAALKVKREEPLVLSRSESYIGALIDDLTSKTIEEPYRMMTARSEYRLILRQDNADQRLMKYGHRIGLIDTARYQKSQEKWLAISSHVDRLKKERITPTDENKKKFKELHGQEIYKEVTKAELAKRPENNVIFLEAIDEQFKAQNPEIKKQVFIHIKYEGYVERQMSQIREYERSETFKIPKEIDYKLIKGLKKESAIKLDKLRPESIGQASRIAGVNPADIVVLLAYLETRKKRRSSTTLGDRRPVSRETIEH
jgi:tRNA uridine 5-carboxymethylaminomethyl modification enzyme